MVLKKKNHLKKGSVKLTRMRVYSPNVIVALFLDYFFHCNFINYGFKSKV